MLNRTVEAKIQGKKTIKIEYMGEKDTKNEIFSGEKTDEG